MTVIKLSVAKLYNYFIIIFYTNIESIQIELTLKPHLFLLRFSKQTSYLQSSHWNTFSIWIQELCFPVGLYSVWNCNTQSTTGIRMLTSVVTGETVTGYTHSHNKYSSRYCQACYFFLLHLVYLALMFCQY